MLSCGMCARKPLLMMCEIDLCGPVLVALIYVESACHVSIVTQRHRSVANETYLIARRPTTEDETCQMADTTLQCASMFVGFDANQCGHNHNQHIHCHDIKVGQCSLASIVHLC